MYRAGATAARQQWGSAGVWIPETTFFNGPEELPEDIATELRDMMLARKPFTARSAAFDEFAANTNRHNSRWNYRADGTWNKGSYVFALKGTGIFGHTSHILGVAARIGAMDGSGTSSRVTSHGSASRVTRSSGEPRSSIAIFQTSRRMTLASITSTTRTAVSQPGTPEMRRTEVSCMHMIFPLAIRASEVLGEDEQLRAQWKEVTDHLVASPARARCGTGSEIADGRPYGALVYDGPGGIDPVGPQADLKKRFLGFTRLGSFIDAPGGGGAQILRNRLRLREGPGAIDAEHIAGLSTGIHASLLNSHPESLTGEEPVSLFSEWPKDWDAAFTLLARGAFLVSSAQVDGRIPLVEVVSQNGGTLRLSNPWLDAPVTLYREGRKAEGLSGATLAFPTAKGEHVVIAPAGSTPQPVRIGRP